MSVFVCVCVCVCVCACVFDDEMMMCVYVIVCMCALLTHRLYVARYFYVTTSKSATDIDRNYGSQPRLSGHDMLPAPIVQLPAQVPACLARHNMELITLDNSGTAV